MNKRLSMIVKLMSFIIFVISLFFIVSKGNNRTIVTIEDISSVRSIQAVHLVSKYNPEHIESKFVESFNEVISLAPSMSVKFEGTMTGYGPDCEGCGGRVGCPPRQDVRNGNIYFEDQSYGKINIVATDKSIPCGTIVKITNSSLGDEVIAIALDRGGVIKGTLMDFLVETEREASKSVGRQNVTYEIVRWGW